MWLGGILEIYLGSRGTALLGGLMYSLGTFFSAFTCKSFTLMLILYGIIPGIGNGIAYGVDVSVAVRWFPNHTGLVTGIVLSGYGLGALIFNPIVTVLVNPHNRPLPFHVYHQNNEYRKTIMILKIYHI